MLFDLRGRGRRRTIQVIYLSLAILMGGGLVLFGIGGNTSGGLVDAIQGNSGGTDANDAFEKRVETLEKRTQANPQDARGVGRARRACASRSATTGENYDTASQAYTDEGQGRAASARRRPGSATSRSTRPSPTRRWPTRWSRPTASRGCSDYGEAVQAMEIVIDNRDRRPTSSTPSWPCSRTPPSRTARATLAADKAVELAPEGPAQGHPRADRPGQDPARQRGAARGTRRSGQ